MPIALDDVCFNKAGIMERCLNRIFEEAQADPDLGHPTHVDALVLNLERVCQAAIVNKDWRVFPAFVQELGMRIDPKGDPA